MTNCTAPGRMFHHQETQTVRRFAWPVAHDLVAAGLPLAVALRGG